MTRNILVWKRSAEDCREKGPDNEVPARPAQMLKWMNNKKTG
jgi:hypothetical protein